MVALPVSCLDKHALFVVEELISREQRLNSIRLMNASVLKMKVTLPLWEGSNPLSWPIQPLSPQLQSENC
jgi:hypothetical protein